MLDSVVDYVIMEEHTIINSCQKSVAVADYGVLCKRIVVGWITTSDSDVVVYDGVVTDDVI